MSYTTLYTPHCKSKKFKLKLRKTNCNINMSLNALFGAQWISWLCFLFLWPHQFSGTRANFYWQRSFCLHTAFLWADRVQVPVTDQGPDSREQVRTEGKKTKGTQRIIFIKMQMKLNEKLKNVKFWNLLSVNCKPTNSQNSVIINSGHLEENLPLNRIFSSAPLKSLFFLQIF